MQMGLSSKTFWKYSDLVRNFRKIANFFHLAGNIVPGPFNISAASSPLQSAVQTLLAGGVFEMGVWEEEWGHNTTAHHTEASHCFGGYDPPEYWCTAVC